MENFISKPGVFFHGSTTECSFFFFVFFFVLFFCGMAPPHIIGASDFAIRKVSFITQPKTDYPL